jgi:hypothetical protein
MQMHFLFIEAIRTGIVILAFKDGIFKIVKKKILVARYLGMSNALAENLVVHELTFRLI